MRRIIPILILIIVGLGIGFSAYLEAQRRSAATTACSEMMLETQGPALGNSFDPVPYCGCLVDAISNNDGGTPAAGEIRSCLDHHLKPYMVDVCENNLNPQFAEETSNNVNCECFYNGLASRTVRLYSESGVSEPMDEQMIFLELIQRCMQPVSVEPETAPTAPVTPPSGTAPEPAP